MRATQPRGTRFILTPTRHARATAEQVVQQFIDQYAVRRRVAPPLRATIDEAHALWPAAKLAVLNKMKMSKDCDHAAWLPRLNRGGSARAGEEGATDAVAAAGCVVRKRLRSDQRSLASTIQKARRDGAREVMTYSKVRPLSRRPRPHRAAPRRTQHRRNYVLLPRYAYRGGLRGKAAAQPLHAWPCVADQPTRPRSPAPTSPCVSVRLRPDGRPSNSACRPSDHLNHRQVREYVKQLAELLEVLHSNGIVHGPWRSAPSLPLRLKSCGTMPRCAHHDDGMDTLC